MVEAFTAWRKGQLPEMPGPVVDPFEAMAGRSGHVQGRLATIAGMSTLAREVTHLPVWSNGRRPEWWSNGRRPDWRGDYELRTFLTESHRQMTLAACCAEVERRFNRQFSASTLQHYWALLDRVVGPDGSQIVNVSRSLKPKRKAA